MVYRRALSGARRDRLHTPVRSFVEVAVWAFAAPGFCEVWATATDKEASATTARIGPIKRLRILKLPLWFRFPTSTSLPILRASDKSKLAFPEPLFIGRRNPRRAGRQILCHWPTRPC